MRPTYQNPLPRLYRVAGGGPLPTGGMNEGRRGIHGQNVARRLPYRELLGRVAQGVKQVELCTIVLSHRAEIIAERAVQLLQGVDGFLGPVDQDQGVGKPLDLTEALELAVEGNDARRRARSAC